MEPRMFDEPPPLPPLPDRLPTSVEARIGEVEFRRGLPTRTGTARIVEIQQFQRACQLYQWAIPVLGTMALHRAYGAAGAKGSLDWVLFDEPAARAGMLTPDANAAYVVAFPDLWETGPLVLEYCAGRVAGLVLDYWQRPVAQFGQTGPQKGATGGSLLLLGPGHALPDGGAQHRIVHVPTRVAMILYVVPDRGEAARYLPHNRLHALPQRPSATGVRTARRALSLAQPRGLTCWQWLHELLQREPVQERDRLFLGLLRSLGVAPGVPFEPDDRMRRLLEDAALLGEQMVRAHMYGSRTAYRAGSRWQYAAPLHRQQGENGHDQIDERAALFYHSIASPLEPCLSLPAAICTALYAFRDADGDWLEGGHNYRLHIPGADSPRQAWSLSAYDLDTRAILMRAEESDEVQHRELRINSDGSVDLFFGPLPPEADDANWIETRPGRTWYACLRVYLPGDTFLQGAWPLPDIEKVRSPLKGWWTAVSAPARRKILEAGNGLNG